MNRAVHDVSWLLSRGYTDKSSLKLAGDRYGLTERQRQAVMRASCSDAQLRRRTERCRDKAEMSGAEILIDGYNLLITAEVALSGGVLYLCRDGCIRDIASIHGTYRKVEETLPALKLISQVLIGQGVACALWLFDRPVSNSGRLKKLLLEMARENGWNWQVELPENPDKILIESDNTLLTSDSDILDKCSKWVNINLIILEQIPGKWLIDLSGHIERTGSDTTF